MQWEVYARGQRDASAQLGHNFSYSEAITSFVAVKLVGKIAKAEQKYLKAEVIAFHCSKISNKLLIYFTLLKSLRCLKTKQVLLPEPFPNTILIN